MSYDLYTLVLVMVVFVNCTIPTFDSMSLLVLSCKTSFNCHFIPCIMDAATESHTK